MGANRTDLRRAVGVKTGEVLLLRATTAGSASTFTSLARLLDREDNAASIVNRMAYFSGGTVENLGHEARVTAFQKSTKTLTFQPDAPAATQVGDEVEIWSNWARWGGIEALHILINEGIRAVQIFTGPQVADGAQSFTFSAPEVPIPASWCEFGGVDRQDAFGIWKPIPPAQLRVREHSRTVQVMHRGRRLANSRNIRLWGYTPAPLLSDDSTETPVDAEWLIESVASALRLGPSWRASDRAAEERLSNFWAVQSDKLRRKVGFSRPGMGLSLPFSS